MWRHWQRRWPIIVPVSDDLSFDFLGVDPSGFKDGSWETWIREAQPSSV